MRVDAASRFIAAEPEDVFRAFVDADLMLLWLPPEAVRAFEGRRFVVVRTGDRERRVTLKTGIETDEKIEILEGVKEGDVVVGQ